MPIDLATLARAKGIKRAVTLRPINPTQAQAQELAAILVQVTNVWKSWLPAILAGYDPKPLGDAMLTDTADAMRGAIETANSEISRLVIPITAQLRNWSAKIEKWHRGKWIDAVNTATNVDLSNVLTAMPVQETLGSWLERNVALVRDVSDQTRGRISDIVFREYQNRTPIREVAKQLNEAAALGRKRAIRIAADQSSKLSAQLDMERQAEAAIEQYRWRHSGKAHPRLEHQARNGKLFKLGEPSGDTPGQAPYCGCRAQAYLPLMDEFGL
ncbi:MAG: hypothetical protein A3E01_09290 [Gammaproteobacteria bacterium RIFCSPHIGHO2_12_FULL_63_22]|nr:MAG: hypothetical protein A3E01_09290 [Gammaproteobacteria bacterium RIFCSPHIGHO2_12_FULL_63_22]